MERLYFGARARRRDRLRRLAPWVAIASMAAGLLGGPVSDTGARFLAGLADRPALRVGGQETSETAASMLRFRRRVAKIRPTPEPKPRTEVDGGGSAAPGSIPEIIYAAAARHGLSGEYLLSVAECESTLDPGAVNESGYYGLFQFDEQTWAEFGSGSIFDPVAQADAAAELIAAGQSSRWPNCA